MNRGIRKEEIYTEPNDYRLFIETLQESAKLFNLKIAAYCLMPNHYHLTKTKRGIFNEPRGVAIYPFRAPTKIPYRLTTTKGNRHHLPFANGFDLIDRAFYRFLNIKYS